MTQDETSFVLFVFNWCSFDGFTQGVIRNLDLILINLVRVFVYFAIIAINLVLVHGLHNMFVKMLCRTDQINFFFREVIVRLT